MNKLLFSHIPSYLNEIDDLLSCSRKMGSNRDFIVRCVKRVYFKYFIVKTTNSKQSFSSIKNLCSYVKGVFQTV